MTTAPINLHDDQGNWQIGEPEEQGTVGNGAADVHHAILARKKQRQQPGDGGKTKSEFTRPDPGGMHVDEPNVGTDGLLDVRQEGYKDDERQGDGAGRGVV